MAQVDHLERNGGQVMKLQLNAAQAKTLSAALKAAISTEKGKYHLMSVQVATFEDHVTFTATDGYRCHRVTIETPVSEWLQADFLLNGMPLVKELATAAKAAKYREITISYDYGNTATISIGTDSHAAIDVIDMDFPPVDSIINAVSEVEFPAMFNGDYFADVMLAASAVANTNSKRTERGVSIVSLNPRKCGRIESTSDDGKVTFTGVIMPCRG